MSSSPSPSTSPMLAIALPNWATDPVKVTDGVDEYPVAVPK